MKNEILKLKQEIYILNEHPKRKLFTFEDPIADYGETDISFNNHFGCTLFRFENISTINVDLTSFPRLRKENLEK